MSLEEFISDDSYGGSWADDEIDIASISVPIEKNKSLGGSDSGIFGPGGYGRSRNFLVDQGPPYIVKLLHLPVSCDDIFVKDLFSSRFMLFIKFKIVYDPVSNPLETGIVKKSAFVELKSFSDQNRVVNWQDLYYKGNRRVIIEPADYADFQGCMKFNHENDSELRRIEREFLANKTRGSFEGRRSSHSGHIPGLGVLGELEAMHLSGRDNLRMGGPGRRSSFGSGGHNGPPQPKPLTRFTSSHTATPQVIDPGHETPALGPPKPKPNPFGNAKPVDILAKEHEMDKKIVSIDPNTVTALSSDSEDMLKKKGSNDANGRVRAPLKTVESAKSESNALSPAPIPSSIYGQKKSLADILSTKSESEDTRTPNAKGRKSANGTPKPQGKPVILKKKPSTVSSPAHQKELERLSSPDALHLESKSAPEVSTKSEVLVADLDDGSKLEPTQSTKPATDATKDVSLKEDKSKATQGKRSRDNLRRKLFLRSKRGSVDESITRGGVTVKPSAEFNHPIHKDQHHLTERNKSFSSQQRPDFKKHLIEMTLALEDKVHLEDKSEEKDRSSNRGGRRGGRRAGSEKRGGKRSDGGIGRRGSKTNTEAANDVKVTKGENEKPSAPADSSGEEKQITLQSNGTERLNDEESGDKNGHWNSRRGRGRGQSGRGGRSYRGRGRGRGRGGSERRPSGESKDSQPAKPPPAESQPAASA